MKEVVIHLEQGLKVYEIGFSCVYAFSLYPINDTRGHFMRTYDINIFKSLGFHRDWVQESQSLSLNKHTIRGIHFQLPPYTETKLIRLSNGSALFTIVDLRKNSTSFGDWIQATLSSEAEQKNSILVPPGFGSGMCTLEPNTILQYKIDQVYKPDHYSGLRWDDPELNIKWPVTTTPFISEKDRNAPTLKDFREKIGGL